VTFVWTDKNITTLKEKWAAGSSGAIIAKILGTTRNAVIGKAHRLKLHRRTPDVVRESNMAKRVRDKKVKERKVRSRGEPVPPSPVKDSNTLTPTAKSLRDLGNNDCRFPIGELSNPGSGFCGRANKAGSPYCETHWKITTISKSV
jgi:GcrA cell cycle regulator